MAIKVGMVSLGCPKNQVDAEMMLSTIEKAGYKITADAALADVVIINTCGFIESAKQESIDNILEFHSLRPDGNIKAIIVTGCMAQRYKDEILNELPEVDVVVGIGSNTDIVEAIETALKGERKLFAKPKLELPLSGDRILSTPPFYAYVKISEGCSNCCTYCAIPQIRGKYRSRPFDEIISEVKQLASDGVKEIVLVAQDTTRYGEDLYDDIRLEHLLYEINKIESLVWVRVLYCYPERITDSLLDAIASCDKVAKYLDIPIQHCSESVLKNMNRVGDKQSLTSLMNKIRDKVPGIVVRTTLIAGFPQESEDDFTQLCEFVNEVKFDRLGCFTYSQEEGTLAAKMDGQIDEDVKARRAELIMLDQSVIMEQKNDEKVGSVVEVVVEGFDRYAEIYFGRSEADAPEIDGKVFFMSEKPLTQGQFVDVEIDSVMEYDLMGTVKGE